MRPYDFSSNTTSEALARQKHQCASCGTSITRVGGTAREDHRYGEGTQAHHLIHVKCGGRNNVENCVILCQSCHYSAHEGGNYRFGRGLGSEADFPYFRG